MRENSDDVETQEHEMKLKISKANRNATNAIKLARPKASGKLPGKSKANASGDIANVPKGAIDADSERNSERRRLSRSASYRKAKGESRTSNHIHLKYETYSQDARWQAKGGGYATAEEYRKDVAERCIASVRQS
jgi:hypothetical protein